MADPLVLAFVAVLLAWIGISAWVVLDRALYDRLVAHLKSGARGRRLRWRTVARVAADSSSDPELAQALAQYVLATDERGVVEVAQDPSAGWRGIEAARIMALTDHPLSLSVLEHMLADGDEEVRAAAVTILGEIDGEQATALLLEALRRGACPSRWASALLDRRPVPAQLLLPLLDQPRLDVRAVATRLLGKAQGADAGVDDVLLGLCGDPEADIRAAACRALGDRGRPAAADRLESLLSDPVWFVQVRAARALGELHAVGSGGRIAALLSSRHWWVRRAAKDALVDLGAGVREQLFPILDHPDPFARNSCAEVLQNLGVVDDLLAEANAADPRRAAAAATLLRKILDAGGIRVEEAARGRTGPAVREDAAAPESRAA